MNIQNSKKRMVAGTLSVVMLAHAFMPAAAFAAHHPAPPLPPRHHGHHHHDYYRDKWTKHDTAAVAGLAALIGLLAVANNNRRNQTPPSDPMSYAEYRDNFANRLSADDQLVYNKLISLPAGEYRTAYTKSGTLKLVQKLCKKLPYDFRFVGTRVVAMDDGSTKNYIYFNRLEAAGIDNTDVTAVDFNGTASTSVAMNTGNTSAGNYYDENRESATFEVQVLRLVNAARAKVGAAPLRLSDELMTACAIRSEEITRRFAHERPDGSSCFSLVPDRNRVMGENIAAGSATPEDVVDQWMNSPGHRANILDKRFRELGVGHSYKEGSDYGHYWVQMFRG